MNQVQSILDRKEKAGLRIQTLGAFQVWRDGLPIHAKDWVRDKSVQLFQFLLTVRNRRGLHKEQIVDQIWEEEDIKTANQHFKAALHGMNKALEPNRKSRTESRFIIRQGLTYQINLNEVWVDTEAVESLVALGNQNVQNTPALAIEAYREAISLYKGIYLPNRLYEDWSSAERERLQVLILGAYINLGELLLEISPMEAIRICQQALLIENTWEDAYRIQMSAYMLKGNRPMAIKTFRQCEQVLEEEFGVPPLPETRQLYSKIIDQ